MTVINLEELNEQLTSWKIKSVIVHHKNNPVLEWYARGADQMEPIYSCTKSVLSALIGIAIDRGELQSIEQPITDFVDAPNQKKEALSHIQIGHLLTMTAGFDWPDFDKPYKAFKASNEPVPFLLEQQLISEPGTAFAYNSGASHLLSYILTKATGLSALQYAKEHLFGPLHFRGAKWSERAGVSEGGTGLSLYGRDLAKLGLVYLQNGHFDQKHLLSQEWIAKSTGLLHRGLLQYEPPIYGGYGYHWWVTPAEHNGCDDCYFAFGHGGQYLLVSPAAELVIVIRKQITKRNDAILSRKLIFEQLVPAFQGRHQT